MIEFPLCIYFWYLKNACHALQGSPGNWVDSLKGEMVPVLERLTHLLP